MQAEVVAVVVVAVHTVVEDMLVLMGVVKVVVMVVLEHMEVVMQVVVVAEVEEVVRVHMVG